MAQHEVVRTVAELQDGDELVLEGHWSSMTIAVVREKAYDEDGVVQLLVAVNETGLVRTMARPREEAAFDIETAVD